MSSETIGATGLAGRYATALIELADSGNQLDVVATDLKQLQVMIGESDDLVRLIRSPVISRGEQQKAMDTILTKAKMSDLTKQFIGSVSQNRRLFALSSMISAYLQILAERRGEITAVVTSAAELSDKQVKALGASLKKAVGSEVMVDAHVDPSLLGGLIVKVGSQMVDSSLRTKLQQLRLAMKGIG
ncbi:MAG: F0F1 ATP synthase subunit delta [Alphaproteobacteria bacterium]|nr:F0F1 ATP synthase subunit delta [Rhodospirillales bacterium]MCW9044955.1 F0F1 ATP synthase subunit delta [Alphaproteobacteria bacterium]